MSYLRRASLAPMLFILALSASALATTTTVYNTTALNTAFNAAGPGDRILMAPGTYTGSVYITGAGGAPGNPVVVAALNPLSPPVFNLGANGIQTVNTSNFVWDGMTLNSTAINGFQVTFGHNVVLKNFYNVNTGTFGGNSAIKFTGCNNFLMYNVSTVEWGICGVDMVGSAQGLFMNNHISNTLNPNSASIGGTGIQAKGGSYDIGMYNNVMTDCGNRVFNFGGDTDAPYFHQGNLALGWENYDTIAMGNLIIRGSYPVSFSNCNNDHFEYNTVVNPANAFLRILNESPAAPNPSSNGVYSHNLVSYTSVGESVNMGGNINPNSFTFNGNYWYSSSHPSTSVPTLVGTVSNNVGGTDPQFNANYDPTYAGTKAYGYHASGMQAAWLAQVNKFQWSWDVAQGYNPQANAGGAYSVGVGQSVTLNATASTGGAGSYGNYAITSYQWDLNNDGVYDITGSQPTLSWLDLENTYSLPFGTDTVGLKITSVNELNQALTSTTTAQLQVAPGVIGDANGDRVCDYRDYIVLEQNFGKSNATWAMGEFTGDGLVTYKDYIALENGFGKSVPEPATLVLLATAAGLVRRKK